MQKSIQAHYEAHSGTSYESAYFYSPGNYIDNLVKRVTERLGLGNEHRRILDVGGGTGNFTKMLVENNKVDAVVIDPFLESSSGFVVDQLTFVKASAEDLGDQGKVWWRQNYQQVLMKEVIHHVKAKDRLSIFQGVFNDLKGVPPIKGPNILIITRPDVMIDYPLWEAAREVWTANQPSFHEIEADLKAAGFARISCTTETYPCSIPLDRWQSMVRGRFWSTFSNFSDDELNIACELIAKEASSKIDEMSVIHFEDRLLFISAYKV